MQAAWQGPGLLPHNHFVLPGDSLICQDNEKKAGDDLVGVREAEESS